MYRRAVMGLKGSRRKGSELVAYKCGAKDRPACGNPAIARENGVWHCRTHRPQETQYADENNT